MKLTFLKSLFRNFYSVNTKEAPSRVRKSLSRNVRSGNTKIVPAWVSLLTFEEQIIKNNIDLETLIGAKTSICKVRGCHTSTYDYFCAYHKETAANGAMVYCLQCKEIISLNSYRSQDEMII